MKADEIADRFEISLRTVYRDVKALMEAGVPIGSEAGTGYFIVDGYHLPPVMFSQEEASAMLMAGKLVEKMTDQSVRREFESALMKIKAVLNDSDKDYLEMLQSSMEVTRMSNLEAIKFPNNFLTDIQKALVQKEILEMEYHSNTSDVLTKREVEPIGIQFYSGSWHMIGWCHLRKGYRDFRADRIASLKNSGKKFEKRDLISLQEYMQSLIRANQNLHKAVVLFHKSIFKQRRYIYGYATEEDLGDKVRLTFLMDNLKSLALWLLSFGKLAEIEQPEELKMAMVELVEELQEHYLASIH